MSARSLNINLTRKQGNCHVETYYTNSDRTNLSYKIVKLHGHTIARIDYTNKSVRISDCGWQTVTTKAALNNVLQQLGLPNRIYQKKHIWYISNIEDKTALDYTVRDEVFDQDITLNF